MSKESNTYQLPKKWSEVNFEDIVVFTTAYRQSAKAKKLDQHLNERPNCNSVAD